MSDTGFIHPFYCKDILPCLVIRQEQIFFLWQNLGSFSLEHNYLNGNLQIRCCLDLLSIPVVSQNTRVEMYHRIQ